MKTRYRYNGNPGGDSMSHYTYMVTNKTNGKVYVGSHSWDKEGIDPNYYGSGTAITRAVKKYGKENFQVEVLYFYDTVEECRADEERILTEYNVRDCPHSYNIKNGAIGWTSEDMTGEKHPFYGKHHTEEARKKLSQAKKGENNPQYGKRGKDAPMYGKHHTEETKQKIARANKGLKRSEEIRLKLSQAKNYRKTPIVAIQKDTGKIRVFESQMECARQLNLDQRNIYHCLKGRQKTCKGYLIKYMEQLESGIYEGITE